MTHLTLGHLLYVFAAVDAAIALAVGISLRDAPMQMTDQLAARRRSRALVAASMIVTAIAFCLMAALMPAARQIVF